MGNPFKTPKFKELFKKWNNILEESGHKEIEDFSKPVPVPFQWEGSRWNSADPIRNELRRQYYEAAEALLETHSFRNKTERRIWQLHSEGHSVREIADMIHRKGYKMTRVQKVISSIRRTSGLFRG